MSDLTTEIVKQAIEYGEQQMKELSDYIPGVATLVEAAGRWADGTLIRYCTTHLDQTGFGNTHCYAKAWELARDDGMESDDCRIVERRLTE